MNEKVHIKIPADIKQRCRDAGLNISGVCRKALLATLEKVEETKETGANAAKQNAPAAAPVEVGI